MRPEHRNRPAGNGAAPRSGWQATDSVRDGHPGIADQLTLEDADHAASFAWREAVDAVIRQCAAGGAPFTAETVRALLAGDELRGVVDAHPNAFGARFMVAAKRGEIVPAGFVMARRPSARGRALRSWRGA